MQQLPLGMRVGEAARFESFVAGPNAEVLDRLLGPAPPRVLWLWGRPGVGKTHLLQAACARLSEGGSSAAYVPLQHCASLGPGLLAGYEHLDAVLVDDLDVVAGDAAWEGALFTLHNELQENGGRLVVAARVPPKGLALRLPDLASRLAASQVHVIKPLPETEQAEALVARAAARGLDIPPETLAYLMRHAPRDFGALCRLLDEMDAAALAGQRRLTVPLAREVLERS